MQKFKPFRDKLLVKRLELEKDQASGSAKVGLFYLPTSQVEEIRQRGKVTAVSEGWYNDKGVFTTPNFKVGDIVVFNKYSGVELTFDTLSKALGQEGEYLILGENEVLGVLVEEE